jgi:hypothetical protein
MFATIAKIADFDQFNRCTGKKFSQGKIGLNTPDHDTLLAKQNKQKVQKQLVRFGINIERTSISKPS